MDESPDGFDHLLAEPVRASMEASAYGAWRSISAPDAVSLSFGFPFPDAFPTEELLAAAEAALDADAALQYGGGEDADRLADAVADRARERGIDADGRAVELTNGATAALDVVCRTFLDPGDRVVVEAPTFMGSLGVFRNHGADLLGVPVDEDGLDVDALADGLAAGERPPKLVYTVPTFQNPTGTTLSAARRERLLELAEAYDFLVLADDAYGELRYDGDPVPTLAALDDRGRVIHTGTFSKTVAPGVRTGWLLGAEPVVDQLGRMNAGGTNTFTRSVLGRYFADGHYETVLADLRDDYERRRDRMLDCLATEMPASATWTDPDGGFFVWVELPERIDAGDLLADAAEEGVTYLPGSMFFPADGGENCLRLSFSHAAPEEMDRGIAALGRAVRGATDGD